MCHIILFHITVLLSLFHESTQKAVYPHSGINMKELNSIQSYSHRLFVYKLGIKNIVQAEEDSLSEWKIYHVKAYIKLTEEFILDAIKSLRIKSRQLFDLKSFLNIEFQKRNQSIDQYTMCKTKLFESINQRILIQDIIKTIGIEERDFGISVANSTTFKSCFNKKESIYESLLTNGFGNVCYPPIPFNGRNIRWLDREISQYSINIRIFNYALFSYEFFLNILSELESQLSRYRRSVITVTYKIFCYNESTCWKIYLHSFK
ncbi:unnamed protein product [Schistosoma turkestanicum]|nr:unnamed protein product [Schistosoma turkestanicum]